MMLNIALSVCAFASTALGWPYVEETGYGLVLQDNPQGKIFRQASIHPNASASVPWSLESTNLTFRVNVSAVALPGVDTVITDPQAVLTTWDITWPSNTSYDEIFHSANNNNISCYSWVGGSFSSSAAARLTGDGDCTPAFGADCVNALRTGAAPCGAIFTIPNACQSAFAATSGVLTQFLPNSTFNTSNPYGVSALDSPILGANNVSALYQLETQQVQFAIFRIGFEQGGQQMGYPVCARVSSGGIMIKAGMATWMYILTGFAFVWSLT